MRTRLHRSLPAQVLLGLLLFVTPRVWAQSDPGDPSRYDVAWTSPSADHRGSMPVGNGDVALNVWVEPLGDLLFYIGKSDSWGDNGRLLKVGRVRVHLEPSPAQPLAAFHQVLNLKDATIRVRYGEGEEAVEMRVWVDANRPVIHAEVDSRRPVRAVATIEPWRVRPDTLPSIEISDVHYDWKRDDRQHAPTVVEPDRVLTGMTDRIGWYHHNVKSVGPALLARVQGTDGYERPDPLLHRTFGAVVTADHPRRLDDRRLESGSSRRHHFSTFVLTRHPSSPEAWQAAVDTLIRAAGRTPAADRRQAHEAWWSAFWNRSWIRAETAGASAADTTDAYRVSRAYALQRFMNALAGRGAYPIKFNGSLLTVPTAGAPGDADYRRWGPGYWWQNTRLPYYSMMAAGDYDLADPLFEMYARRLMPLFRYRTQRYFGHEGAFISECIYFWGDVFAESYGWTPFEDRVDKLQESRWHKWEWVSGLELVYLMLDYYEHTLDARFLRDDLLPTAHEILTFFDRHYPTGPDGRMVMHPAQSLETWWDATNPMPEVAGLHAVVERLSGLPSDVTPPEARAFWARLREKLPPLPTRTVDGTPMLAAAERFADKNNIENPELYAVFPFRRFAFNRPDAALAVAAFDHRTDRGYFGWRQEDVFAAYLGLADTTRNAVVYRATHRDPGSRFPAFWGPNYDWTPDQDHGAVLMKALQSMLLQTDGRKIYLLPAWPKDWNATFRLHAPMGTTVEGRVRDGRLEQVRVVPEARQADLVVLPAR